MKISHLKYVRIKSKVRDYKKKPKSYGQCVCVWLMPNFASEPPVEIKEGKT